MTSGDTWFFLIRIASTLSSLFATSDLLDALHTCHDTVAELSEHNPTCSCLKDTMASITSHPRSSAAISRSELIIVPFGFSRVTRASFTSCGSLPVLRGTEKPIEGVSTKRI